MHGNTWIDLSGLSFWVLLITSIVAAAKRPDRFKVYFKGSPVFVGTLLVLGAILLAAFGFFVYVTLAYKPHPL